ncbi:unnamed protein product [Strongylus vulgaris]|uniref:Protein kinase domain-containing protein n=1 Tax=Strongylus vulgaris TaxID=40348 RepID=A0A3P7IXU5_STRVU|nr:unnamed protein product [Strongylus vulgaris]
MKYRSYPKKKKKKKKKELPREKMEPGQVVASDSFRWKVIKILGSGGFGDVYKVVKENDEDKKVIFRGAHGQNIKTIVIES